MRPLTIKEIAKAVGGRIICSDGNSLVNGVSTDTRKISEGELFFALTGENSDGHDYIDKAYERGCRAAVVSKEDVSKKSDMALILVEDTLKALQVLAQYYLNGFKGLIKIGITGSTGKTSTKELLYWSLCGKYKTVRNFGNFNNHIGMPLTVLSVEAEHQAAIFEMGMGAFGEVDLLAKIAHPHIAIITNIGVSHLVDLGSRENILKAKLEITNYFNSDDILIINFDNDLLSAIDWGKNKYKVVKVGQSDSCKYQILHIKDLAEEGIVLTMKIDNKQFDFKIPIPGIHNGYNGALAVAAAVEAGTPPEMIVETIKNCEHTDKRLVISESPYGVKVIDDTYNASPDSMKAGINVLKSVAGKRKVIIFGSILGMGNETERYHREVGEYAGQQDLDLVLTVSDDARYISDSAAKYIGKERSIHFESKEALMAALPELIQPGDAVLVKASRAIGMEKISEFLLKNRS